MGKQVHYLLCILFALSGLHAQDIEFEHYNDENGLSHNSVRHIVQDGNGFLWLGTFSGLNRFDGFEFKSYTSSSTTGNTIPNDDITALELDQASSNLWIGTRNGLVRFKTDTHTFSTFLPDPSDPNSIQEEEIRAIHVDRFQRVWVGTKNEGLFIFHPKKNIFKKVGLEGFNYVKEIFEDSQGHIWIGSYRSAGVVKITLDNLGSIANIKAYTLKVPNSEETNPYIHFIYENHVSDVFVGSRKGLYKLNRQKDRFDNLYIEDSEVRDKLGPYFISVARAPDGKYWVGTLGGILVMDDLEDITGQDYQWYYSELSDHDSLADDLVNELYFDASGVLWIGTEGGLDKYDPYGNQFRSNKEISKYIGNQIPRIRGFSKTFDGKIIIATRHNGLFIYGTENTQSSFRYVAPLYRDRHDIASIYSTDGNTFYCGLWNGQVLMYDYGRKNAKIIETGLVQSPVLAFANMGGNSIVVGSHGQGSIVLNTKTGRPDTFHGVLLPNRYINQIAVDSCGKIWYATQTGVATYDLFSKQIKSYRARSDGENGLSHENVSDILIDSSGKIWAATRKGLDYYVPKLDDFIPVTKPVELKDRWVTDIVADHSGNLWLNMNDNRIASYNPVSQQLNMYYTDSGNRLDIFSPKGFYYTGTSQMYLTGKNGFITFMPERLQDNTKSPPPIVTDIRIQNKRIDVGDMVNGQKILQKDLNSSRELVLEHDNKNFSLTFSSPSYINERFNKYSYTLAGFDEGWNTVDVGQRSVQYTNLFFGSYIFKVKAMNSHGIWSEVSAYKIEILPPFWLSYEALFILLLVLTFVFFQVRKTIRSRMRLKQQWLMEKVKRERDEKLSNEKLHFFTNISHELRTPLTLILGPARQLVDEGAESGNQFQQQRSNLIYQNAKRLLNLVNQVLDLRRAQSGELRLKVAKTDILLRTRNTFRSFQELADDKKIHFNLICENADIAGYIDHDKYDKMLYNLLSNALKFTHRYGHVDLFIGKQIIAGLSQLQVEISDDGIGIPKESQKKIFSRFYQAPNSKENNTGSGIGLSLVKTLVELHKGKIEVHSAPNKGSTFTLKIPISKVSYLDGEILAFDKPMTDKESPQLIAAKRIISGTHLKERILIIEDNSELRNYLVDYLSDYYKVFSAVNGKKGIEICRKVKPGLCVVDVMMPEMNGLDFCKELKNDSDISHIPVILLTALSDSDDKIRGYTHGADGYLVKPFELGLLKTRIENIIKSRIELKSKFSNEVGSEIDTLTHSPADKKFMGKLTKIIHDNIEDIDLNTSLLCGELGMGSSKLYRKIKELTDLAPNEFIRTLRLKKAAQLLHTKKYNVSEVTDLIGFNDPLYFSRCFKKQFGYPPSQLIK